MERIEHDPRERRATLILTGGCLMALLTLAALWTAGMLYAGFAKSLAWGEEPGHVTIWMRDDVPLLLKIGAASLALSAGLLTIGARRVARVRAERRRERSRR